MSFAIEKSPEIRSRREFGRLCNQHQLIEAAEVGTDRALFAVEFLRQWNGFTLLCIDPYEPYPEMPSDRSGDLMMAAVRLAPYAEHAKILRARSPEVIASIPSDARIDFVYIDGAHDFHSVYQDVTAWWERLRDGGILAGHDFDIHHPGVMEAVTQLARDRDLTIYTTYEGDSPPSWYCFKPAAPKVQI